LGTGSVRGTFGARTDTRDLYVAVADNVHDDRYRRVD
jgi:hypothetical protein